MFKMVKNPVGMASLYIVYNNAGALYETNGKYGTSHLMEHMICKTLNPIRDELQANGIAYNAATGNEFVAVYCTGLASRMEKYAQKFVDTVLGGVEEVTELMFKNEQSTVLQEYSDAFADPLQCAMENGQRKVYGFYDAIGLKDDVKNFTFEDFKRTYEEKFRHPTSIVYVGPNEVKITGVDYAPNDADTSNLPMYNPENTAALEETPDTSRASIMVFGTTPVQPEDATAVFIGVEMLGRGLNSPLYREIREKRGLSYYVFSALNTMKTIGYCMFGANTEKESSDKLAETFDLVFNNVGDYLTEERFNICLNKAKIDKEKREVLRFDAMEEFVREGCTDPLDGLENLTYEDVKRIVPKYINKDNLVKYVM